MKYRSEIDGLRALAVMPVVFYHAGLGWMQGGYLGVDVFFVISGYLITTIIADDVGARRFSLVGFYERRARRILPALFAMMFACLAPAWFLMAPYQLKAFGDGLLAVGLFVSNLLFYLQAGYFTPSTALNPLIHTWSLAVEEQYYLLYPLGLLLLLRLGRWVAVTGLVAIAVVSLMVAHLGGSFNSHFPFIDKDWQLIPSSSAFLLTPARAWELMAGGLLAIWPVATRQMPRWLPEAGSTFGLVMILWCMMTYSDATPTPSIFTIPIVLGTVLVLLCATQDTLTGRLLGLTPLVWVGFISYSIYLWHQPLLAFLLLADPQPSLTARCLTIAACFAVGWASWRFIERPFRDHGNFSRRQIFGFASTVIFLFLCVGSFLHTSQGASYRYPPEDRYLLN